jgi:hypothetical protein
VVSPVFVGAWDATLPFNPCVQISIREESFVANLAEWNRFFASTQVIERRALFAQVRGCFLEADELSVQLTRLSLACSLQFGKNANERQKLKVVHGQRGAFDVIGNDNPEPPLEFSILYVRLRTAFRW